MAYGVFIHRHDSIYNDIPEERYQFPKQYLTRVQACVGDWILYYEPRHVAATRGYFAVAKVEIVIEDPTSAGMFIALIGEYLPFVAPVPFSDAAGPIESGLLNAAGKISGRAQSAVRPISVRDFNRILDAGLDERTSLLPRRDLNIASNEMREETMEFELPPLLDRRSALASRTLRDPVFRRVVLAAYGERCAVTGLRLINGGGRAEVEAAHIQPVENRGPDSVRNGIALSGTAHWMFDRGLIGLADDLTILVSRQANDPESIRSVINPTGRALVPAFMGDRPHPHYLRWHRENCFKH